MSHFSCLLSYYIRILQMLEHLFLCYLQQLILLAFALLSTNVFFFAETQAYVVSDVPLSVDASIMLANSSAQHLPVIVLLLARNAYEIERVLEETVMSMAGITS
ncbi:hypothetical protein EDC96DRAFT_544090 [Choanephora cucurbitarum]|nr:hypothetical protein EDC96DRAFT_544090 [Choanephora cucurbitarum]